MTVTRKIKCAGVTSARRAGLTMYGSLCFGTQKSVVIRIKLVNFRENISAFRRDKRNCTLYTGVRIMRVSIERTGGSTVLTG